MEIHVHGPGQEPVPVAVTMRTPGNDFELAVGLCRTEGIVESAADVETVAYCLTAESMAASISSTRRCRLTLRRSIWRLALAT